MNIGDLSINDFFYPLPDEQIAKYPLENRDQCKLLVYSDTAGISDGVFSDIPMLLPDNSVLVYNDSKVINARLKFRKGDNEDGSRIEVFCLEPIDPPGYYESMSSTSGCKWKCFVGNSKKWKADTCLNKSVAIGQALVILTATRHSLGGGAWEVELTWNNSFITFSQILESAGEIPIPPYLNRGSEASDLRDYQTVYSTNEGSVAAPTAGLHFTSQTLNGVDAKGIARRQVTLHVGAGTFQPVTSERIAGHVMHHEFFSVEKALVKELFDCMDGNEDIAKRIIAVGTTSVRTLESLYYVGCLMEEGRWEGEVPQWYPYETSRPNISLRKSLENILNHDADTVVSGETQLIIVPGFQFRIVDGLITNFHQPGSTLLLLISAFLGRDNYDGDVWRAIYSHALEKNYRFLSYGDACLFL